jgi:hypothetical protein
VAQTLLFNVCDPRSDNASKSWRDAMTGSTPRALQFADIPNRCLRHPRAQMVRVQEIFRAVLEFGNGSPPSIADITKRCLRQPAPHLNGQTHRGDEETQKTHRKCNDPDSSWSLNSDGQTAES